MLAQPKTIEQAIQATIETRYPLGIKSLDIEEWHDEKYQRINTLRARLVDSIGKSCADGAGS